MISTILLTVSFLALCVVVVVLNIRLNSCFKRISDLYEGRVTSFDFRSLKADVLELKEDAVNFRCFQNNYKFLVDYYMLKDEARLKKREREEREFECKHFYKSKSNPKKTKHHGK